MQKHEFESYTEYRNTQINLTKNKVRKGFGLSTSKSILEDIIKYHTEYKFLPLEKACCHGVRRGEELDLFEELYSQANWIGTEITPDLCDNKRIIQADFSERKPQWQYRFDLVYSNSLDHALDPEKAVSSWLDSIKGTGRLYVEWCAFHNKLSTRTKADCFAATTDEYRDLFNSLATVEDVIVSQHERRGQNHIVFVVKA